MKDSIQSNSASSAEVGGVTPMVERVAMAMQAADRVRESSWEHESDGNQWAYRRMARAAIEAMREPTDEMMRAAYEAMFDDKYNGTQAPLMYGVHTAMITAALKEPAGGVG